MIFNIISESNERVEGSEEQRIKRDAGDSNVSNIFISPSSIFQSLMLAYFGAAGETEAELAKTMGFSSVERDLIKKSYVFERAFQVCFIIRFRGIHDRKFLNPFYGLLIQFYS